MAVARESRETSPMAEQEDGKPTMSAECRVQALPLSGADISIDGLRLRLDIRIVPRSKDSAASTDTDAILRVVSAKLSRVPEMPAYQWAAVMLGVGFLLVAITLWIAKPSQAPVAPDRTAAAAPAVSAPQVRAETAMPTARAPEPAPVLPAASNAPAAAPAPVPSAPPSTSTAPIPAPRTPRVEVNSAQPSKRPEPFKKTLPPARTAVAAAPPEPASAPPQPVAQRPAARSDMLDLFGDIK
jgi:hypothetical protein